ncbi:hypothetical protein DPEC_G00150190 [Dallia pectoralis]|uniref:Uncharacterized protein n=1 Tax=Dallia pectoralis TaxID=75939 RepID=A0ACC2GIX2_DALPE|nr:hypothetical protein DPEC_G00150190 [Dallia pectoralis]
MKIRHPGVCFLLPFHTRTPPKPNQSDTEPSTQLHLEPLGIYFTMPARDSMHHTVSV